MNRWNPVDDFTYYLKSWFRRHPYRITRSERRRYQLFLWVVFTMFLAVGVAALLSLLATW